MLNTPTDDLEAFRRHIEVERGLATWPSYRYPLQGYLRFLAARGRDLMAATRDDVVAYLELKKNAGLKGSSLYLLVICVRQFHRFLVTSGRATAGPTDLKLPKFKQRLPDPLSVDEMERLLAVPAGAKFHRTRMFCALQLMWSTGMRVSEITGLKLGQINLEEGWVRSFSKGGRERILPVGPKAKEALLLYLETRKNQPFSRQDTLFFTSRGHAWTRGAFWWQLKQLAREAGLSGHVFPHRVRHSFGTQTLLRGAPIRIVQQMLSHKSVQTTQRYTHVLVEDLRAALKAAHPRF